MDNVKIFFAKSYFTAIKRTNALAYTKTAWITWKKTTSLINAFVSCTSLIQKKCILKFLFSCFTKGKYQSSPINFQMHFYLLAKCLVKWSFYMWYLGVIFIETTRVSKTAYACAQQFQKICYRNKHIEQEHIHGDIDSSCV